MRSPKAPESATLPGRQALLESRALPASAAALTTSLLAWYGANKRLLPWRGTRDPYGIWVSEVMLQQTQAAVVKTYYQRFLDRFPDVERLARAPLSEVLGLWSGLGYYGRARALHAAAQTIVELGAFPRTLAGLRALPGFGPYTAAAVGSIAFDLPEPAIDGNAVRVYARLVGSREPRAAAERSLRALTRPLLKFRPSEMNQAVMDLGQLVCTARAPRCALCPWRPSCRAHREGTTAEIPVRTLAKPRQPLTEVVGVLRRGQTVLLARRRESGLFGGLWELPGAEALPTAERLEDALLQELGLVAQAGPELARVQQTLTHRDLTLVAFQINANGGPKLPADGRYLEAKRFPISRLAELGLSSASRRLFEALGLLVRGTRPPANKPRRRAAV